MPDESRPNVYHVNIIGLIQFSGDVLVRRILFEKFKDVEGVTLYFNNIGLIGDDFKLCIEDFHRPPCYRMQIVVSRTDKHYHVFSYKRHEVMKSLHRSKLIKHITRLIRDFIADHTPDSDTVINDDDDLDELVRGGNYD